MSTNLSLATAETPKPWERRPGERSRSYHFFDLYRQMGAERSLAKVRNKAGEEGIRISLRSVEKLSRTHSWVSRCRAWDSFQVELEVKERE